MPSATPASEALPPPPPLRSTQSPSDGARRRPLERRDLTGKLPIDTSLTLQDIADAPYPSLTLVIDGVIALRHRRGAAVAAALKDAWA